MKYDTDHPTVFAVVKDGVMETDGDLEKVNIIQIDFEEIGANPAYALETIVLLRHVFKHHNVASARTAADYWLAKVLDFIEENSVDE